MKTSTSGSKSLAGCVSFRTLAPNAVVDEYGDDMDGPTAFPPLPPRTTRRPPPRAEGENARAVDARARERADLETFIVWGPWRVRWVKKRKKRTMKKTKKHVTSSF